MLRTSALAADAAGDDQTRVRAFAWLIQVAADDAHFQSAHDYHLEAVAALKRLGSDEQAETWLLDGWGAALAAEGKLDDARATYEALLALKRRLYGEGSWQMATALGNLAGVYATLGQSDRALELEERAVPIETAALGEEHPFVGNEENTIGAALANEGKEGEAEPHFRRAVRVLEGATGADSQNLANYLTGLGFCVSHLGRYEEALALHQRALAIREKVLRPDHPELVDSLAGVGEAYLGLKDARRALPFLERAVALRGLEPAQAVDAQFFLARALDDNRTDAARALALARKAKATLEDPAQARDPRRLAEIEDWLALRGDEPGSVSALAGVPFRLPIRSSA